MCIVYCSWAWTYSYTSLHFCSDSIHVYESDDGHKSKAGSDSKGKCYIHHPCAFPSPKAGWPFIQYLEFKNKSRLICISETMVYNTFPFARWSRKPSWRSWSLILKPRYLKWYKNPLIPDTSTIIKISLWPRFQTKNSNHSKYAITHFGSKASFALSSKYGIILHAAIA